MSIDTLGYAKRLESAGLERRLAEAHAEALRDEVAPQLVTKQDLDAAVGRLERKLETDIVRLEQRLGADIVRLEQKLGADVGRLEQKLDTAVVRLDQKTDSILVRVEGMLWKHSLGVLLGVLTIGGLLARYVR